MSFFGIVMAVTVALCLLQVGSAISFYQHSVAICSYYYSISHAISSAIASGNGS
jgi:hypothetical protein